MDVDEKELSLLEEEDKGLSEDLNKKIHDIERDGEGWSEDVEKSVKEWMDSSNYLEFVYDSVLGRLTGSFQKYNNAALAFSGFSTIIGFLSTLDLMEPKIISTTASGLSFMAFIAMGLAKNKNLTTRIREISTYFATVKDFSAILEAELQVPKDLRKNAREFLTSLISEYRHLLGSKPHLTQKEKEYSHGLYEKHVKMENCLVADMV